jgi:hypothetical protein
LLVNSETLGEKIFLSYEMLNIFDKCQWVDAWAAAALEEMPTLFIHTVMLTPVTRPKHLAWVFQEHRGGDASLRSA